MITIGVDPGASGALAFLDDEGQLLDVHDMPYLDGHVVAPVLADMISYYDGAQFTAWVERAQSMPGMGVSGAFKYGAGYGVILGVLGALLIPTETIRPNVWKGAAGLSKDKNASRRRAIELWPAKADQFALVKHDGRAEAALIARHGWVQLRREVA